MDKLTLLNERRVSLGKPALKSWKGSKAKLEEAIALLGHALPTKEEAKPIARAITTKVETKAKEPTTKPLPRIARSLGIDPKAARAKLRKMLGAEWHQLTEDELRAALTPA